ncbi:MAG: cell division protein ZapA [Devosia sp.]|uniref:cell division protein ZapA n=1 Tax=Devosia sp. TaxID=1871048 RepID=UPI001AD1CAA9|nr:cell division protein ZapA [Devosia sp.]MBN9308937.1 cell division protein ZapA [Devosia sp.]MBN9317851.1 cell division protein ZapA [Devosia sp.]
MPEVNVDINGRKYRMACEEGQEPHLLGLADRFNRQIDQFKGTFGEIGDNRLTVMAGIAVLDELAEAERRIAELTQDVANLTRAGEALTHEAEELERKFAKRLNEAARKIEAISTAIDETGAAAN